MAEKPDPTKAAEPPKPVQIGGESLVDRLLPHVKKIMYGFGAIALIVTLVFGYRACKHSRQAKSTGRVAEVLRAGAKPFADSKQPADPIKNPGFTSAKERAEAMLAAAEANGSALPNELRASLLFDAGRFDDAIAAYNQCEEGITVEAVTCREGLGIALEAKAVALTDAAARQRGLEEALAAFARMQPAEDGPRRVYAIYHQARLQLLLGKKSEGKQLLEKAKQLNPPPDLSQQIEQRLSGLGAA